MTNDNDMQNDCRPLGSSQARLDRDIYYLEKRILSLEKLMDAKFDAQKQAVETANAAMQARFESVNEFRAAMGDQAQKFVTRDVVDANFKDLTRRLGSLEERMAGYDGRIIGWSAGSAAVVLVIAIVAQLLNLGG